MFPNNPLDDLSLKKLLATCHKETQTNNASLKDSGTATNSGNVNTSDKGSLKVFEFSELVQDPKHPREITIIKDVFAEEIHDHNSPSGSVSDDAIANRYTYCREVIKPYLKDYPKDCPVSEDQLIRDALEAAHEDFPDYEPCFEGYDGSSPDVPKKPPPSLPQDSILQYFGIKDTDAIPDSKNSSLRIKGKSSSNISVSQNDKTTSQISVCKKKDTNPNPKSSTSTLTNDKSSASIDKRKNSICLEKIKNTSFIDKNNSSYTGSLNSNMDKDKVCAPEKSKVRDRRCPKTSHCPESLEPCYDKENECKPPGPPSACKKPVRNAPLCTKDILDSGTCSEGRTLPPLPKGKTCEKNASDMREASRKSIFEIPSTAAAPEERKKTIIEAHSETIATIKSAVEDFFGKVYQSTKEAVTVIRTESAKHLGRLTAKKSGSGADLIPQRVHENKSTETITSFNYFRSTDNPEHKNQGTENETTDDNFSKAGQAIGKIFATVDSTISMLSDQIDLQKVTSILKIEPKEESSPYDKTIHDTEEPVSTSTSIPNSVFTAIRTRIASMFGEGENETKDSKPNSTPPLDTASSRSRSQDSSVNLNPSKKRY